MHLSAPNVRDMDSWEGAAISSTSRLLLPIDELSVPPDYGEEARQRTFSGQPLMRRLESLVLQEIKANSEPVLPEPVRSIG